MLPVAVTDDRQLLEAWRRGDSDAGRLLFRKHFALVRGFFAGKTAESEELSQRTFEAIVKARGSLEIRSSVRAYILAVARNQLYAWLRERKRNPELPIPDDVSLADMMPTPSRVLTGRAEQRLLLEALRSIPLDYQIVVELHYWDELTTAELAEIVDVPLSTVKTRLRRARELLADRLAELAETPALLESTTSDLDRWARGIREQAEADAEE